MTYGKPHAVVKGDWTNEHYKRMGLRAVAAGCNGRRVPGSGPSVVQAGRAAGPEGGPEDVRDVQEVWRRA